MFFKAPTVTQHERGELFGTVDFVSNVGGLMGLFLGFSAISLMEMLYYLGKCIFVWAIFDSHGRDHEEVPRTSWVANIKIGSKTKVSPPYLTNQHI